MSEWSSSAAAPVRDVFVGRHSKVWHVLSRQPSVAERVPSAIGHCELEVFAFSDLDRVWILSYSRRPIENAALLERLQQAGVREIVYVSSASTIVCRMTSCYSYPRVKHRAELDALALPSARVLTLGLMYEAPSQLPGGTNVATAYSELAAFIAAPDWPEDGGRRKYLMRTVTRPFGSAIERLAYFCYGRLLLYTGHRPCLLRPIDVLLRALGARWYGYVYLTNRLWTSTIS